MSWASRRQFKYVFGVLIFVALILLAIFYPLLNKAPTCMDKKQNGDEQGIDCGGSCQLFCPSQVTNPTVLWSRAFHVSGSTYNLLSYVENPNRNAAIYEISYEFRVYDTDNKLIGRREGKTFIPPNQRFAIFEARFDARTSTPRTTTFEFTSPFFWLRKEPVFQGLPVRVDRIDLVTDVNSPQLTARITNDSIFDLPQFDVIAIIYDAAKNAIGVSKTQKEGLKSNSSMPLNFTWPQSFPETPVTRDILPQINPFLLNI